MRTCSRNTCWLLALFCGMATGCQMMSRGHNVEGTRLYKQGSYRKALESFELAAQADPQSADAYYNMAATLHRMGVERKDQTLITKAEELYNRSLDIDPNHANTHRGLAVLLSDTGQSDRAFKLIKGWALRSPRNADARIELARLHHEIGQDATAELLLHDSLKINLKDSRAWAALGSLREHSGNQQQAIENYQKSISLNSFQPQLADRIARLNRFGPATTTDSGTRMVDQNWVPRQY